MNTETKPDNVIFTIRAIENPVHVTKDLGIFAKVGSNDYALVGNEDYCEFMSMADLSKTTSRETHFRSNVAWLVIEEFSKKPNARIDLPSQNQCCLAIRAVKTEIEFERKLKKTGY